VMHHDGDWFTTERILIFVWVWLKWHREDN
jgi:hypothetical protein